MSRADVQGCVSSVVPCAHMAWPKGCAPELPWAVFYASGRRGKAADNRTASRTTEWCVELYERSGDSVLEDALEAAIEAAFGPCSVTEAWVEEEQCLQTSYYFTSVERKQQ